MAKKKKGKKKKKKKTRLKFSRGNCATAVSEEDDKKNKQTHRGRVRPMVGRVEILRQRRMRRTQEVFGWREGLPITSPFLKKKVADSNNGKAFRSKVFMTTVNGKEGGEVKPDNRGRLR